MAALILARLQTANYEFTAVGVDVAQLDALLAEAWERHAAQTGATYTWAEVAEDVNYSEISAGEVLRDGERF